jgi:hypothetical protein
VIEYSCRGIIASWQGVVTSFFRRLSGKKEKEADG